MANLSAGLFPPQYFFTLFLLEVCIYDGHQKCSMANDFHTLEKLDIHHGLCETVQYSEHLALGGNATSIPCGQVTG
jgi:hypothetical protein